MSLSLIILSILILGLGIVPFVRPRSVFEFPYVVGMFLAVWLLPQCWAVERYHLAMAFDPTLTWKYMTLCIIFLLGGYAAGRGISRQGVQSKRAEIASLYNEKRMAQACIVLIAVGAFAYIMMTRMSEANVYEHGWTGVITVYATLTHCLTFGAALTFLIYLRTKNRFALILFCIATAVALPVLLIGVRRNFLFNFAIIILGSLFLVRGVVPPRLMLLAGCVIGAFIVNNTGEIRAYVKNNDTTLVGALTSSELLAQTTEEKSDSGKAPEVSGAVTDISIANDAGVYYPVTAIYNGFVSRYFPAFIFGRDAKNAMMMAGMEDNPLSNRFFTSGATRTGFSDTFLSFWYFGVFAFLALGVFYGWTLNLALAGGLRGQYLYVSMLGTGLHAITHSFSEFVAGLPFLWLIVWLPFRYARITPAENQRLMIAARAQASL